jgi:hypothetical protein
VALPHIDGNDHGDRIDRARRCAIAALAALAAGCALTYHTAPRYRYYPPAAEEVEAEAAAYCRALGEPAGEPEYRFVTDGCSVWPDGVWQECCVEHDMAYWCGGSREDREKADERLQECVTEKYAGWMGWMMRAGVRIGGPPWMPARWRWGYGHRYPSSYTEP